MVRGARRPAANRRAVSAGALACPAGRDRFLLSVSRRRSASSPASEVLTPQGHQHVCASFELELGAHRAAGSRFHAGLSCSQIALEIGVTRNAVIGKMNRLGLSRPRDVVDRQLEQRRDARLAHPKITASRPRRARPNIFAQHELLREAFPEPSRPPKTSPSTTGADARCSSWAGRNAAGRSAPPAPRTSVSAATSRSKGCPIARGTRASRTGGRAGTAAAPRRTQSFMISSIRVWSAGIVPRLEAP